MSHLLSNLAYAEGGINVDVDLGIVIKEIVLSPFNPLWINSALLSAINVMIEHKKLNIPVNISPHMAAPKESNQLVQNLQCDRIRAHISGPLSHLERY